MSKRAFLLSLLILIPLVVISSPPLLKPLLLQATKTPTATVVVPSATPTASATPDPFAFAPTATVFGNGSAKRLFVAPSLPTPVLSTPSSVESPPAPPTVSPTRLFAAPTASAMPATATLSSTRRAVSSTDLKGETNIPVPPTPDGNPPERLSIPALELDVPVEPVGMIPSDVAPGVFEWEVPAGRVAGWLNTSASPGRAGNTVLDGHHNIQGEVFRGLWELVSGDEIVLSSAGHTWHYRVDEVLILPERDQPLEVRLKNASWIQPTEDERLTLITCWPYSGNTHRVVVIAFPRQGATNE